MGPLPSLKDHFEPYMMESAALELYKPPPVWKQEHLKKTASAFS